MNTSKLLGSYASETVGVAPEEINALTQDSRAIYDGVGLYFAVIGTQVDGHNYINQAIQNGARVIVCSRKPTSLNESVYYVYTDDVLGAMAEIVPRFYGHPDKDIKICAITGTNGKSTIATLLYQALIKLNQKAALFSTAGDFAFGQVFPTTKKAESSMELIELYHNLSRLRELGCTHVCLEATSHGLDQGRLGNLAIDIAIFTNLTQDHLDYHNSFEDYAHAKKKLFDMLDSSSSAIVNIDSPYATQMIESTSADIMTYGSLVSANPILADILFEVHGMSLGKTDVSFGENRLQCGLIGDFNMYNLVATFAALQVFGFKDKDIVNVLSYVSGAKGRLELVPNNMNLAAIVDYAHTPDALENVLNTLQKIDHNRIITVVGAGGDRDRGKRPQMAEIAERLSDVLILTSDNPRTEDPAQILDDMTAGCIQDTYIRIDDRRDALEHAVDIAREGDIILVAGKGHEEYQIIGTTKHYFSDQETLREFLDNKKEA